MTKRKYAVEASVANMITGKPELEGQKRRCYFWTLTTPDECDAREVLKRWNSLRTVLARIFGKLEFIRVLEPHASGLRFHIHLIIPSFMPVTIVREKCRACGFGRIHVVRVRNTELAGYLAKYFTKGARVRSLYGVKLFGASLRNQSWYRVRLSDVEYLENGQPLSEECKRRLWLWKRTSGSEREARMEYLFFREHADELKHRNQFAEWARDCARAGDDLGAAFWGALVVRPGVEVEVEICCDESGVQRTLGKEFACEAVEFSS